uniref:Tectonin beta-propeller repeat containing 2 n=1 Tax=Lepisosteus oculatus TaxID=7918 RepID=W5MUC4_LEPOC|nr:PREDICTED: tectonin beta-propeller repeat-containing protein 2 [Lepisosteus oculatus]XP_015205760.1 PREDICTED: tectonin beta-propeller repeat-containing protein 2 [Lepisosteus oculatus]
MAAQASPAALKEFCPLYYLLNTIPAKVQRGFRSVLVYLTALDASSDYIAVGSSIGMLYLYCRRLNQMNKYNLEGKTEAITSVKLLSCFDDLVAVGTASGRVALFQLVSPLPGRNKQLRRFDVVGLHKSTVTALAWSANGMKLFSGDDKGKVVYSAIDLDQGVCNPSVLLEEQSAIVQLEYSQKVLLVSTHQHSLLFYTEEKAVQQVGTKPRKGNGKFGACFHPGLCKQSDLVVYAARPGLRLWKADVQGSVQATYILKDVFAEGVRPFELFPRAGSHATEGYRPAERQLGLLSCFLREGWVLSWNEYSIYVLDSLNQAVVGGLEGSGDIVSVSCTDHEIFLLKGDRDIIRISSRPEGLASSASDVPLWLSTPTATAPQMVQPTGAVETAQPIRTMSIIAESRDTQPDGEEDCRREGGRKEQDAVIVLEKIEVALGDPKGAPQREQASEAPLRGGSGTSESRSRSSSVTSWDSALGLGAAVEQSASELSVEGLSSSTRFSTVSTEDFEQELVVKSIRVRKKKKKKRHDSGNRLSDHSSWSEGVFSQDAVSDGTTTPVCELLSDRTSLLGSSLDLQSADSPDREGSVSGDSHSHDLFAVLTSPEVTCTRLGEPPSADLRDLPAEVLGLEAPVPQSCETSDVPLAKAPSSSPPSPRLLESDGQEVTQKDPLALQSESNRYALPGQGAKVRGSIPDCDADALLECNSLNTQASAERVSGEDGLVRSEKDESEPHVPPSHTHDLSTLDDFGLLGVGGSLEASDQNLVTPFPALHDVISHVSTLSTRAQEQEWQDAGLQCISSDEEDIYAHAVPHSASDASLVEQPLLGTNLQRLIDGHCSDAAKSDLEDSSLFKSDQFAESWMGYSGPGYGILSLVVSEKYIWCLDFKGVLYCSPLPSAGLRWQKFEDSVQQVAVSPSGSLLWKVEQKTNKAFACGKVTIKSRRHWYEAIPQTAFVALSDDTAWIIRTNGDLYLQTGLSVDRPCARAVKVDCPCPLTQITARGSVVWALTEQRGVFYREGLSSFCTEGEQWKCDAVSESQGLEPVCIALGDHNTAWALDTSGNLWFRTGITAQKPQGEDDHWWQVSITDYVVFDQCSLFQTIIQATHSVASAAQAPVEKVADRLRVAFWSQQPQCQPSLLGVNSSGVWIASGRNDFHVAKGSLIGTYWANVVPRGTASAAKWAFVIASSAPTKEGSFLWLGQSCKDLFCISDQCPQFRPSTVQLPPEVEMVHLSACQDAVWGLDTRGRVYIRTLSKSCPTGMHWTPLDLSQLGRVKLSSLSCGSQNVWACDANGMVYFRVGTQPLNPSMMLPAWISIEPPEQPVGVHLVSVYTSPNDRMLWAVDSRGYVHVRTGITEEMPVGTDWEHVPGLQAWQLAVSARTVWVRCPNGDVARRYGITEKNPAGDYWKKIPGLVSCLTVTPVDELWAVGMTGSLIRRLTKAFCHSNSRSKVSMASSSLNGDDPEDEWEVI